MERKIHLAEARQGLRKEVWFGWERVNDSVPSNLKFWRKKKKNNWAGLAQ